MMYEISGCLWPQTGESLGFRTKTLPDPFHPQSFVFSKHKFAIINGFCLDQQFCIASVYKIVEYSHVAPIIAIQLVHENWNFIRRHFRSKMCATIFESQLVCPKFFVSIILERNWQQFFAGNSIHPGNKISGRNWQSESIITIWARTILKICFVEASIFSLLPRSFLIPPTNALCPYQGMYSFHQFMPHRSLLILYFRLFYPKHGRQQRGYDLCNCRYQLCIVS